MPPTPPRGASPQELRRARDAANRYRAEWLLSVASGMLTVTELIDHAGTEPGRALRTIRLLELLRTQDGWGMSRAKAAMRALRQTRVVPGDLPDRKVTIGWLLDHRTKGQRYRALNDVTSTVRAAAPWPLFPYADWSTPLRTVA